VGNLNVSKRGWMLVAATLVSGCAAPTSSAALVPSTISTPAAGAPEAISVRLARLQGISPLVPTLTIYEGGRLLTTNEQSELVERRLSPPGVDLVRAAMVETGLFEHTAEYPIEVRAGVQAPGMEVPYDRFELSTDAGMVQVGSFPLEDPTWMVPSPERHALIALAERLVDLSWLPDDAWVSREPVPYHARAYLLLAGDLPMNVDVDPAAPDMAAVAWPFAGGPQQVGAPFISADGSETAIDRCVVISPEALSAVEAALRDAGAGWTDAPDALFRSASVPWRSRAISIELEVRPLLPEESLSCAGKSTLPTIDL
jgi:hypothetical protein